MVRLVDVHDKDTSIADLSGSRGLGYDFDDVVNLAVVGHNFDSRFREERDLVFNTAIDRRVSLLVAMATDFRDSDPRRHALDPLDEISELFWTDDALNELHYWALCN